MSARPPQIRALLDGEIFADGRIRPGERRSPATEIRPGERRSPTTEFKPGERRSVATEFRPGGPAHNRLPVGAETARVDVNGTTRIWVKVADPNKWELRARVVWTHAHGPIPRGRLIHHIDHNATNDTLSNLALLTRREHVEAHRADLTAAHTPEVIARTVRTRRARRSA